ncbi:hypothetical protein BURK_001775 [Burkholderia sp. SJ98]|nr:hypothetical protein BURK_001775 [Burkholderia sp. SJ98]
MGEWVPVWFSSGTGLDGVRQGFAHHGKPQDSKRQAWHEARRMCEQGDGVGFMVARRPTVEAHK